MEKQLNGSTEQSRSVPKLRFPEYKGEWEKKKLGEVAQIITGNTPPTSNQEYYNGDYLFVSPYDIDVSRWIKKTKTTLTKKGFEKGRKVRKGSTLFVCIGSTIGKICQIDNDCITNQQINSVISYKNDDDFIYTLLENHSPKIKMLAAEQAVPIINKTTFSNYEFSIPSLPEQSRIASFFAAIDEKINLETQRLASLKQYKKGVMQKLFSQELRFKDENGKEFPDWEVKQIKNIFKVTRGNVLSMSLVSENQDSENKYSVYSSQTRNKGLAGYYKDFLFENAITWTTDGAGAGDVNFRKGKFYCTNVCGVLLSEDGYANLFIAELLNSISKKFVSYVGNPKLMNNIMSEIKILIPQSIQEQTKIANFLSAIDEKINQTENKLNKMQTYKKGLLQQMFV